jgi:hypothetical protein
VAKRGRSASPSTAQAIGTLLEISITEIACRTTWKTNQPRSRQVLMDIDALRPQIPQKSSLQAEDFSASSRQTALVRVRLSNEKILAWDEGIRNSKPFQVVLLALGGVAPFHHSHQIGSEAGRRCTSKYDGLSAAGRNGDAASRSRASQSTRQSPNPFPRAIAYQPRVFGRIELSAPPPSNRRHARHCPA